MKSEFVKNNALSALNQCVFVDNKPFTIKTENVRAPICLAATVQQQPLTSREESNQSSKPTVGEGVGFIRVQNQSNSDIDLSAFLPNPAHKLPTSVGLDFQPRMGPLDLNRINSFSQENEKYPPPQRAGLLLKSPEDVRDRAKQMATNLFKLNMFDEAEAFSKHASKIDDQIRLKLGV